MYLYEDVCMIIYHTEYTTECMPHRAQGRHTVKVVSTIHERESTEYYVVVVQKLRGRVRSAAFVRCACTLLSAASCT